MERRAFLRLVTCLPLFALRPVSLNCTQDIPKFDPKNILLLKSNVAGFRYYRGESVWAKIKPGDPVILKREPRNPYDRKAIALYWYDHKLGYIPRIENSVIANLLDQGASLTAFIRRKKESLHFCERLEIEVRCSTGMENA